MFILLCISASLCTSISCYECNSSEEMTCGETLPEGHTLESINCSHVHEAQYCVKWSGAFEGGMKEAYSSGDGYF